MAIIDNPGSQLPGSDNEQFQYGGELGPGSEAGSQVPGLPEQLLPGMGDGGYMGAMSGQTGLQQNRDSLYNSDGSNMFNDTLDSRTYSGGNSMEGLALENPPVEVLANENMYGMQGPNPLAYPLPDTAQSALPFDAERGVDPGHEAAGPRGLTDE
jgi:hypothetical protein